MPPRSGPLLGGAAAVVGAVAYGINIPTARMAGQLGVSGALQGMIRGVAFILILAAILIVLRRSFRIEDGEGAKIAAMGVLSGVTGACYLSAVTFMPVALAVSIFYTFPLFLILVAPITGSGRVTPARVAAFVVAFAGILICVGPSLAGLDWRGVALALAASVACAGLFEVTARVRQDRLRLIFWVMVYAQAFVIPAALVAGAPPAGALAAAAIPLAVSATGFYIGFAGQIVAGRLLAPATVGLVFLLEPVVAVLAAGALLGEAVTPLQAAGIALVIGGLALDVQAQNRAAAP